MIPATGSRASSALVTRWGDTLAEIAVQEMQHLTLATNLLTAVGATPHFHRPNLPIRCQWYPPEVQVALVPFGEEALRHFLYLEHPDHAAEPPLAAGEGVAAGEHLYLEALAPLP